MELLELRERVRASGSKALVVDPRLVRRASILTGGIASPRPRGVAITKRSLLAAASEEALHVPVSELEAVVILVPAPTSRELAKSSDLAILRRYWRLAFHSEIRRSLGDARDAESLTLAHIRERIHRLGGSAFQSTRIALENDHLLGAEHADDVAYIELAALWFELRTFSPDLVPASFPSLGKQDDVDAVLSDGIAVAELLERSRPRGADLEPGAVASTSGVRTLPRWRRIASKVARLSTRDTDAANALARGNVVRALLVHLADTRARGRNTGIELARSTLDALSARLDEALVPGHGSSNSPPLALGPSLFALAERASAGRLDAYEPEARLLLDLQRAALASEREHRRIDLLGLLMSLGRKPLVRPLRAVREVRIATALSDAWSKLGEVRLSREERERLVRALATAVERADGNARAELTSRLRQALTDVGLRPESVPERVARDKLVEELLDTTLQHGYFSFAHLRDAVANNQLKLDDLRPDALNRDALLALDRVLDSELEGVYRRADIYLRAMQRWSALAFGTRAGRSVVAYAILPIGGAFVVLEAGSHLVAPVTQFAGFGPVHLVSPMSWIGTAAALFSLLHSQRARAIARRGIRGLGWLLAAILLRAPRWILSRAAVLDLFARPAIRAVLARVALPAAVGGAAFALLPETAGYGRIVLAVCAVLVAEAAVTAFFAALVEEAYFDWIAPSWRTLSDTLAPRLVNMVTRAFRGVFDLFERSLYRVDEWLRFRDGDGPFMVGGKATLGLVWFFVAYVIRLYVTLLVEPEINPVKHFPVVTVAHKLMLPFAGDLLSACRSVFTPLGSVLGATAAATTAFLLPSISGFLAWELKENWRLYRQNRDDRLEPVAFGIHGETMPTLLIHGFHAGTLPRLFDRHRRRVRRALARSQHEDVSGSADELASSVAAIERQVARLCERELIGLLRRSRRWTHGSLAVDHVKAAPNSLRIAIVCPRLDAKRLVVAIEQQGGRLMGGVDDAGFVERMAEGSESRVLLENALAGFYHLAGIEVVREELEHAFGRSSYRVTANGFTAYADDFALEAHYPLTPHASALLVPTARSEEARERFPPIERKLVSFRDRPIRWQSWVEAWSAANSDDRPIARLLDGPSLFSSGRERRQRPR